MPPLPQSRVLTQCGKFARDHQWSFLLPAATLVAGAAALLADHAQEGNENSLRGSPAYLDKGGLARFQGIACDDSDVFVVSYGGWSSGEREERYADRLKGMLERDGREYNDSVVIAASYDSPMTFFGRHNEVWLLKLDDGPAAGVAAAGSGELLSTSAVEGELTNTTLLDELSGGAPNSTLSE